MVTLGKFQFELCFIDYHTIDSIHCTFLFNCLNFGKIFVGEIQSFQCDQEQLNPLRNLSGENFSSANSGSMDFH